MSDPVDIGFKLLPPKLQMQLWVLALDANTRKVNLAYRSGSFRTSLAYHYGGNLEASLSLRRVSATIGVNPASGDVDLRWVFRGLQVWGVCELGTAIRRCEPRLRRESSAVSSGTLEHLQRGG